MHRFLNAVKGAANAMDMAQGQPRIGTISSVDPNTYSARVQLRPEDVLTGWLPIQSTWIGSGWGLVCLPEVGDQVIVIPQEGNSEHGLIIGRLYNDQERPPVPQAKEFWLVHNTGSTIKMVDDGIWLTHHTGSFVKLVNDGTIQIQGDVHVAGEIYDRHGSLDRLRGNYNMHTHGGVSSGTAQTLPTTQIDPE